MKYPAVKSFWGQLLTALLIAGGSDGVFRLFTKLNIRNPQENRDRAAQPQVQAAVEERATEESESGILRTEVAKLNGLLDGKNTEIELLKAELKKKG